MATKEGAKFFSETKTRLIKSLLSKAIGLVVRGKDGIVIHLKSKGVITGVNISSLDESHLCVWGISGLEAETRSFKAELTAFWDEFGHALSLRDLNISVLSDFVSSYLAESLFSRTSERPSALEFILCETSRQGISCAIIDFMGESRSVGEKDSFAIVGCTNKKRKEKITKALIKLGPENIPVKELSIALESLTKDFEGEPFTLELAVTTAVAETLQTGTIAEVLKLVPLA